MTSAHQSFAIYHGTSILALHSVIDSYYAEEHKLKVTKATYPLESGASITDHAVREPTQLKLQGAVSDLMPALHANPSISVSDRGTVAWLAILRAVEARQPVTVITALAVYEQMLITGATAPVDRTTGLGLAFTIELEELLLRSPLREGDESQLNASSGPAADRLGAVRRGRVHAPVVTEPDLLAWLVVG